MADASFVFPETRMFLSSHEGSGVEVRGVCFGDVELGCRDTRCHADVNSHAA